MATARPRAGSEVHWPTSFEILRFVTRALAVDEPKPIVALKGKQVQRLLRGRLDEIAPGTAWAILVALVDRYLVQDPVLIGVVHLEGRRKEGLAEIAGALAEHLDAWNDFAAWHEAQYRSAPEAMRRRALLGQLRFAALDIGIYLGYFAVQAGFVPPTLDEITWNVRSADDHTLRNLLKLRRCTRDELVKALGMRNPTTVDRWCDQGRRPSDESLGRIAKALEPDPEKRDGFRQALRGHYAMRCFVNDLADVVGCKRVQDLVAAVLRFAKGTHTYLTSSRVRTAFRAGTCEMVVNSWLKYAPSPKLVARLLEEEPDPGWRGVMRGLQVATFWANQEPTTLPDGRQILVMDYPRVALYTIFDAVRSSTFIAEDDDD